MPPLSPHSEMISWDLEASQVQEFRATAAISWLRNTAFQFGLYSTPHWLPDERWLVSCLFGGQASRISTYGEMSFAD